MSNINITNAHYIDKFKTNFSLSYEEMQECVRDVAYDSVEWDAWKHIYFKVGHEIARPMYQIKDILPDLINDRLAH